MEIKNKMELKFDAISENESFARVTVAAFAARLDPTLEDIEDLKTAVSEAVTNAIIHGYDDKGGIVTIKAELSDHAVEVEIIDYGCGIDDIKKAREPLYTSRPDMERSGMGFTVMETFTDDIRISTKPGEGTSVWMMKKFSGVGELGDN